MEEISKIADNPEQNNVNLQEEALVSPDDVNEDGYIDEPVVSKRMYKSYVPLYLQNMNRKKLEYLFMEQKEALEKATVDNSSLYNDVLALRVDVQNLEFKLQGQEIMDAKIKKLEERIRQLEDENMKLKNEQEVIEQKFKNEKRQIKKDAQKQVFDMQEKLNLVNEKYKEISRFETYISELEKDNRELNEKFREMDNMMKSAQQYEYEKYQLKLDNIRKKILSTLDLAKVTIMQNAVDKVNNGNKIMMLQNSQLFMELNNQSLLIEKLLLDLRNKEALIKKLKFDLELQGELERLISTHNVNFKNIIKNLKPKDFNPILNEFEAFEKQKEEMFTKFKVDSNNYFKNTEVAINDKHFIIPTKDEEGEKKIKTWKLDKMVRKSSEGRISTVKSETRFARTSSGNFLVHPISLVDKKDKDKEISYSEAVIGCKDNTDKLVNMLLKYKCVFEVIDKHLAKPASTTTSGVVSKIQVESEIKDIKKLIDELLPQVKDVLYEAEEIKIFNLKGINCVKRFNPKKYENKIKDSAFKDHLRYNTKLSKLDLRNLI